jgi:hypothetical protein
MLQAEMQGSHSIITGLKRGVKFPAFFVRNRICRQEIEKEGEEVLWTLCG